jgi:hypothetical protein
MAFLLIYFIITQLLVFTLEKCERIVSVAPIVYCLNFNGFFDYLLSIKCKAAG